MGSQSLVYATVPGDMGGRNIRNFLAQNPSSKKGPFSLDFPPDLPGKFTFSPSLSEVVMSLRPIGQIRLTSTPSLGKFRLKDTDFEGFPNTRSSLENLLRPSTKVRAVNPTDLAFLAIAICRNFEIPSLFGMMHYSKPDGEGVQTSHVPGLVGIEKGVPHFHSFVQPRATALTTYVEGAVLEVVSDLGISALINMQEGATILNQLIVAYSNGADPFYLNYLALSIAHQIALGRDTWPYDLASSALRTIFEVGTIMPVLDPSDHLALAFKQILQPSTLKKLKILISIDDLGNYSIELNFGRGVPKHEKDFAFGYVRLYSKIIEHLHSVDKCMVTPANDAF